MSAYEDDIRQSLKSEFDAGFLSEAGSADDVFGLLAKVYPASGSQIDWKRVPGAIERSETDQREQPHQFVEFFNEMIATFELSGPVLYAGDSATDFALAGSIATMQRILPVLIAVPQHHYFVGPNATWCICMRMEGGMGFGRAATPLSLH
jgi:hypothetical protein